LFPDTNVHFQAAEVAASSASQTAALSSADAVMRSNPPFFVSKELFWELVPLFDYFRSRTAYEA
jgi:hypothetical protein